MRHAALKKFLARALAVCLLVIAHVFLLNLGHPATAALAVVYAASFVCLAVAAGGLLWYRTMD